MTNHVMNIFISSNSDSMYRWNFLLAIWSICNYLILFFLLCVVISSIIKPRKFTWDLWLCHAYIEVKLFVSSVIVRIWGGLGPIRYFLFSSSHPYKLMWSSINSHQVCINTLFIPDLLLSQTSVAKAVIIHLKS